MCEMVYKAEEAQLLLVDEALYTCGVTYTEGIEEAKDDEETKLD